jgi:hypothetical protein
VIREAVQEGLAQEAILENLEQTVTRAMWFPEYRDVRYRVPSGTV